VSQDNGGNYPDTQDLLSWANSSGFTSIPALGMTAQDFDQWSDIGYTWEGDFYIPTIYQIGPDMRVLAAEAGSADPGSWL
jgi:hypothetical protein